MKYFKAICVAALCAGFVSVEGATITGLGFVPGRPAVSHATAISADGTTVVGYGWTEPSNSTAQHAFRWSTTTGMEDIHGAVVSDFDESEADAVSADGSVVVGRKNFVAFRWTRAGGVVSLGDLPGGPTISTARAVSADGSLVFGSGYVDSGFRAFKWTDANGMVEIAALEHIYGCSGDGKVAIGNAYPSAMRWQEGAALLALGDFGACTNYGGSFGAAVSRDGKVLIGHAYPKGGSCDFFDEAFDGFRWTTEGGLQQLGRFNGGFGGTPEAVSADGMLIGGLTYFFDEGAVGLLWDASGRAWKAWDVLAAQGVDLSHWKTIKEVAGISDDGLVLAGYGLNVDGKEEAFRAVLDHRNLFGFSSVERKGNSVVFSWPKSFSAARAEIKQSATASWAPVTETAVLTGDVYVVTAALSGEAGFFRLVASQ